MKTIKVSEATNSQLDWLVAKCQGRTPSLHEYSKGEGRWFILMQTGIYRTVCAFTTEWSQIGPIIDLEKISIRHWDNTPVIHAYLPTQGSDWSEGQTPLIAAARCYVASKLGDTVEVPEELECTSLN